MRKLLSIFLISFSLSASIPANSSEVENMSDEDNSQNFIDMMFGTQSSNCRDYPNCVYTEEQQMIEDSELQNEVYIEDDQESTSETQPK